MFALADGNNFYASGERLFAPRLEGQPIIVLSNNDGCVIARSNEAKALGIPMGAPYFTIEALVRRHRVAVFSSNFPLYGDLSRRVMQVLSAFAPRLEVYSIDECFLDLTGLPGDLTDYGLGIVKTVRRWTGIPLSMGIAPTKTLAKLANRLAKQGGPVLDWSRLACPETALAATPVEALWGIADRTGARLRALGIDNALALRDADPKWLRGLFGVVLERMVRELRGVSCLPLEIVPPPRQQIQVARSFGTRLTTLDALHAAIARFTARAGEKLRAQQRCAQALSVFIHTSPFDTARPAYSNAVTLALATPSQDSAVLIRTAWQGLQRLFRPGYAYQKAGVLLLDLAPARLEQGALFTPVRAETERSRARMAVMDRINRTLGRQTVQFASEILSEAGRRHAQRTSPAYTTRWDALPRVRAE